MPSKHWKSQRMVGRAEGLPHLIGNGLARFRQALADAHLGQLVDQ